MSLATSLQRILDGVDDAEGVALIGMDGIVVDEVKRSSELDLHSVAAEYCGMWRELDRVSGSLALGGTRECMIASETRTFLFRKVTADYFLAMALTSDGNTGKGRFSLRYNAPSVAKEL